MDPQKTLADALTQRLGMQISLSSLPVVEEWMDARLTRWLESIPLPMEMPSDGVAEILVSVTGDMQRLTWSAYGTPRGFIPKLAKYLDSSGAKPGDLARINAIGEAFEPKYVGSWIRVTPGHVGTGWQFQNYFELATLRPHLGEGAAADRVARWIQDRSLSVIHNVRGSLGSDEISIRLPLDGVEGWKDIARAAFADLLDGADVAALGAFLDANELARPELIVGYEGDAVSMVGVGVGGVKSDDIASLCRSAATPYEADLAPLGNAMGADGVDSIGYFVEAGQTVIEARFVPGTKENKPGN